MYVVLTRPSFAQAYYCNLVGGTSPQILQEQPGSIRGLALSADGSRALIGTYDGTLRLWDFQGVPRHQQVHHGFCSQLSTAAGAARAVFQVSDGTFRVWNFEASKVEHAIDGTGDSIALSGDGRRAVWIAADHLALGVWNLNSRIAPTALEGHQQRVTEVCLSPDGKLAVSCSLDHTIRVWDLTSLSCLSIFVCDAPVLCCRWAADRIAAGDEDGNLHLFAWKSKPTQR